ncbi:hypothetical protein DDB_G0272270 [Dictyostelium discoideum AX4]|uniref:Uncharacterized protein n=1 Tax=Dictyostelium discoideum TaxID=44689 RepID=Q559Y7_DICDI|nr:hypothetical protein DDB_G0272270 [Dictyostelium discoideum AX4]EAL71287.1 hypothetical protein DDB_G0272270 [Dictyostelium discoideum AX4]|eukprot:XP_645197.1 hypothetical protein DDB_G0272270 [Dictyostelium discoideum AX4]
MKTLIKSLVLWKTSGTTLKTKTTIINTYSLSPITYLSYLEEFTKDEEIQINKLISWFMNSPANSESPTLIPIPLKTTHQPSIPCKNTFDVL